MQVLILTLELVSFVIYHYFLGFDILNCIFKFEVLFYSIGVLSYRQNKAEGTIWNLLVMY